MAILDKLFGFSNKKILNELQSKVDQINAIEEEIKKLSDEELKAKTLEFRKLYQDCNKDLDKEKEISRQILPQVFTVMREAMRRVWGERHFDVQLMGGIVLDQGKIAEMKTGEGKTIVAALPLYLNALSGKGVHLITVNDYLARHQGEGMGEVYNFLGLSCGIIQSSQESFKFVKNTDYKHYSECDGTNLVPCSRVDAYACDITYGTNNEFGFDYLRDNMVPDLKYCVQRGLHYAIVDEVDSILIDEARTPLIISAAAEESTSMYQQFSALVPRLKDKLDYVVDEKDKTVALTDDGIKKMEQMLGIKNIYETNGISTVHHLEQALKAHTLFKKNRDYIVKDGEIIIVDEFTGRLMQGRRYSEGLHQAIEAKENVEVKRESQTMATISFQNLFRLYQKLAGMTGTAATEAEEFYKIYKLDVVEVPTNKQIVRNDFSDRIYKTEEGKLAAVVEEIKAKQEIGQPVLVGTVSVEKNEKLSKQLKKAGVKHEILNAKNHEREAKIIIKAGQKGSVTVATNMAGRGTDIKLGEGIRELGGLFVLGTERHESRRIDNQLRGRAGRQGDPGASQFYVSMEDDLMRIFGGDRLKKLMDTLGLPEDMPIENKMISRSIESAQRKVEGHNFDIRKHLVEYDDVMNKHREAIYKKRQRVLEIDPSSNTELKNEILDIIHEQVGDAISFNTEDKEKLETELKTILGQDDINSFDIDSLKKKAVELYQKKESQLTPSVMRQVEKAVYLRTIDMFWVEHLTTMDELRTGIGLRGYGQRDPLVEYKQEAYMLFNSLIKNIEGTVARTILKVEAQVRPQSQAIDKKLEYEAPDPNQIGNIDGIKADNQEEAAVQRETEKTPDVTTVIRQGKTVYDRMSESIPASKNNAKNNSKVGRNDPCPCGSGKKYKKCCGKN